MDDELSAPIIVDERRHQPIGWVVVPEALQEWLKYHGLPHVVYVPTAVRVAGPFPSLPKCPRGHFTR